MTTTLLLIRHGETAGNREGLFRGQKDFPLNENGRAQARTLAQELSAWKIDAIYSSPLTRANETARPLAKLCELPVLEEPGFTNIHLGEWEGRPKAWVEKEQPELWRIWVREPENLKREGAETLGEVQVRAFSALERIVEAQTGETVAVVSHRAVLKPLIARCLGIAAPYFWKIHMDNAAYSILEHTRERGYMLTLLNQTRHLQDFVREMV
jgi:broad specificity phosphatase PhoE